MSVKRRRVAAFVSAALIVGIVPAVASAAPPFDVGFEADCYHDGAYVTTIQVTFGAPNNAGTAFHIESSTSILTSNGYSVDGQAFPPRGMPAVDARGDSVVCSGTFEGSLFEITGWITPRG